MRRYKIIFIIATFISWKETIQQTNAFSMMKSYRLSASTSLSQSTSSSSPDPFTRTSPGTTTSNRSSPPFQLQKMDHIVLRCKSFDKMFHFYTQILGCKIDNPETDVGRFDGVLTHLRAGEAYIDLLAYDISSKEGKDALLRMHAGGKGIFINDETKVDAFTLFDPDLTNLDHFCLRIDSFDEQVLRRYFEEIGVDVIASGERKGAEGIGPSLYVQDPEGNVVELKGPSCYTSSNPSIAATVFRKNSTVTFPKSSLASSEIISPNKEDKTCILDSDSVAASISNTPCNRICRYNADFYDGKVCIGCFRESYEISAWSSMSSIERSYALYDAIDRCSVCHESKFEGSVSVDDLQAQAKYWTEKA